MIIMRLLSGKLILYVLTVLRVSQAINSGDISWWEFYTQNDVLDINLTRIIHEYSAVCPLNEMCDPATKQIIGEPYPDSYLVSQLGCRSCSCYDVCLEFDNCCPDEARAYLQHRCVDTQIYPKPTNFTIKKTNYYHMVTGCSHETNATLKTLCEESELINPDNKIENYPVTSKYSNITFRNKYCAYSHGEKESDLVKWHMDLKCHIAPEFGEYFKEEYFQEGNFQDGSLLNDKCVIAYEVGPSVAHLAKQCMKPESPDFKIKTCNLTGLWQYDPDIQKACSSLSNTYRKYSAIHPLLVTDTYESIFCYICNPSIVSTSSVFMYVTCNITGKWPEWLYDPLIEEQCLTESYSDRFRPFKNKYCLLCNKGMIDAILDDFQDQGYFYSMGSQSIDQPDVIEFSKHIYPQKTMDEIITNTREIIQTLLDNIEGSIEANSNGFDGDQLAETDMKMQLSLHEMLGYATVCGYQPLCNKSYVYDSTFYGNNISLLDGYSPPYMCTVCSCSDTCGVYEMECCFDKLIELDPYSCVSEAVFPRLHDSFPTNSGSQNIERANNTLSPQRDSVLFYLIHSCRNSGTERWLSRKCLEHDDSDFLNNIPIYNNGLKGFRNIYCYFCSSTPPWSLKFQIKISCDTMFESDFLMSINDALRLAKHKNCLININLPEMTQTCKTEEGYEAYDKLNVTMIRQCNISGNWKEKDDAILSACENDLQYQHIFASQPVFCFRFDLCFANIFCFLCNPQTNTGVFNYEDAIDTCSSVIALDNIPNVERSCKDTPVHPSWLPFKNAYCHICYNDSLLWNMRNDRDLTKMFHLPYRRMFSVTKDNVRSLIEANEDGLTCKNGTYDNAVNACRQLYCNHGQVLQNGTCRYILDSDTNRTYAFEMILSVQELRKEMVDVYLKYFCNLFSEYITGSASGHTDGYNIEIAVCKTFVSSDTECFLIIEELTAWQYQVRLNGESTFLLEAHLKVINASSRLQAETFLFDLLMLVRSQTHIFNTEGCAFKTTHESLDVTYRHDCIHSGNPGYNKALLTQPVLNIQKTLFCTLVELEMSEFHYFENNSIVLLSNDKVLSDGNFILTSEGRVRVCLDDIRSKDIVHDNSTSKSFTRDRIYNILSATCTLLSILCLLLNNITYCLISELRTQPGFNNMLLSSMLLFALAMLYFSYLPDLNNTLCELVGILTHYFWMTAFFSMNVCAFHMFYVFYLNPLSVPSNSNFLRVKYCLYIFVSSGLIICTVIVCNLYTANSLGYGTGICFVNNFYPRLFGFTVPCAFLFLSNAILFGFTIWKLISSPPTMNNNESRQDILIYIKLFTITGITWPLLMLDSILSFSAFSYVATLLNSLQGVFIFVAFVCNSRTIQMYKKVFRKPVIDNSSPVNTGSLGVCHIPVHRLAKPPDITQHG